MLQPVSDLRPAGLEAGFVVFDAGARPAPVVVIVALQAHRAVLVRYAGRARDPYAWVDRARIYREVSHSLEASVIAGGNNGGKPQGGAS